MNVGMTGNDKGMIDVHDKHREVDAPWSSFIFCAPTENSAQSCGHTEAALIQLKCYIAHPDLTRVI